jgi:hypothetical protein
MKHIKLFEDYSEEELRDLQDDLHGIGHKTKFVQGEDFGFGHGFKEETGYSPRISQEMLSLLIKRGEIIRNPNLSYEAYEFKTPQKWGIPKDSLNPIIHLVKYSNEWILAFQGIPDKIRNTTFNNVIKKLGEIRI